jgi:hypothetical protein
MKIKMLKTERGSQDGVLIQNFKEGEIYDVVPNLASVFVDVMKVAEYVKDEPMEQKSMGSAPENKMADVEQTGNKEPEEETGNKEPEEEFVYKPRGRR